ncbi:MAG: peptidoglycan-binding protein, partial [Gammaproteobacteria bacterium]|nr:peptidoglycan-binding protein [Gammaproteobacteria bacterium]
RKFFMERKNSDYRRVGNSYMYEPYKEELTFGGMIDEKQRKELAQAQKELAKFEKELAAMPASQRKMMESMMGSQMEQLRKMVDSGAATITILTKDIIINPDLGDKGVMYTVLSEKGSKSTPSDYIGMMTGGALVQLIQQNLTKLGYQPGAATGELSDETRAAISKYQKDKGLAVTGNASAELARQTQNEVEALSL